MNEPDNDDANLLREGLRASPLSPEALKRIRAATEAEWRATVATQPARRWRPMAIAASLLGVAVIAGLTVFAARDAESGGEPLATLVRAESPGLAETRTFRSDLSVTAGSALLSKHTYRSTGQSLLALERGGNLRVAAGSKFEVLGPDLVQLDSGELYVDIPPGSLASPFVARTPAGDFQHLGTQFALAVSNGETRLRVREGEVRWIAASGESAVKAGNEVMISRDGRTAHRTLAASDESWAWTSATTPDFDVENRPLKEFLVWVARESGRSLVLADDATRQQVATIRMHGNVNGLTPMQALSAVMAATPLRYELAAGEIRVSFAGASTAR